MLQVWLAAFEDDTGPEPNPAAVVVRLDPAGTAAPSSAVVGRNPGCALRPPGADGTDDLIRLVSREHLRLEARPDGALRVVDLHSTHGTEADARPVGEGGEVIAKDEVTVLLGRRGSEHGAVLRLFRLERDPCGGIPESMRPPDPDAAGPPRTFLARSRLPDVPGIVLAADDQAVEFTALERGQRKAARLGWGRRCVPRLPTHTGPEEAALVWRDGRDRTWLTSLCPAGEIWIDGVAPARVLDTVPLSGHERISISGEPSHTWLFHAAALSAVDLDLAAWLEENPEAVIGRAPDAALVLADPFVSRRHARIVRREGRYWVEPLAGRAATRVNGREVSDATPLGDGDLIEIGSARIVVHGGRLVEAPADRALAVSVTALEVAAGRPDAPARLRDVGLHLPGGALGAVFGPSGSGKSTLLGVLAGMVRPQAGEARVGAFPVAGRGVPRGHVAFVPQDDRALDGAWTAREALVHEARLASVRPAGEALVDGLVGEVLERVRLGDKADTPVDALSGGQRRRLAVAMALLTRPRVLLADEPTSGLDRAATREVLSALRAARNAGCTVVVATHDTSGWLGWTRVVLLADGKVAFEGTPAAALAWFGCPTPEDAIALLADRRGGASWVTRWSKAARAPGGERTGKEAPGGAWEVERTPAIVRMRAGLRQAVLLARQRRARRDGGHPLRGMLLAAGAGLAIGALAPEPRGGAWDVFLASLAALWFGVAPAARELPEERGWAVLARRAWLGTWPYVVSRLASLGARAAAQAVVLALALAVTGALPGRWAESCALLVLLAVNGSALGLLVGALARDARAAQGALPALLVLQALLAAGGGPGGEGPTLADWVAYRVAPDVAAAAGGTEPGAVRPAALRGSEGSGPRVVAVADPPSGARGALSALAATRWAVEGLAHVGRHDAPEVEPGGELALGAVALAGIPDSLHAGGGDRSGATARYAAALLGLLVLSAGGTGAAVAGGWRRW